MAIVLNRVIRKPKRKCHSFYKFDNMGTRRIHGVEHEVEPGHSVMRVTAASDEAKLGRCFAIACKNCEPNRPGISKRHREKNT